MPSRPNYVRSKRLKLKVLPFVAAGSHSEQVVAEVGPYTVKRASDRDWTVFTSDDPRFMGMQIRRLSLSERVARGRDAADSSDMPGEARREAQAQKFETIEFNGEKLEAHHSFQRTRKKAEESALKLLLNRLTRIESDPTAWFWR